MIVAYLLIGESRYVFPIFAMKNLRRGNKFMMTTSSDAALKLHGKTVDLTIYTVDCSGKFLFRARCGADLADLLKNQVMVEVLS